MKYMIKKLLIESQVLEMVKDNLSQSLKNHNILSSEFEKVHELEIDKIESRDKTKNDIIVINESVVLTKLKHFQSKIDPTIISKAGLQKINKAGENQQIMNQSKENSDAYAARSLTRGNAIDKIESITEVGDITNNRKDYRSGPDSNLGIGNVTIKKAQKIPTHHDRVIGKIGNRPILPKGIKKLRVRNTIGDNGNRLSIQNGENSFRNEGVTNSTAKQDKYKEN